MIISIASEKAFDKIQHPFMIKTLQTLGIEGTYLNIIEAIYDKPTANIILNGGKTETISSKIRKKTWLCALATIIQHSFGSFSHNNQRQKRNKRNPNRTRRNKTVTVCRWHDTIQRESKDATRKRLELINEFGRVAGYKINAQKSLAFLYTNDEKSEREIKETLPLPLQQKD